jgi:transposase
MSTVNQATVFVGLDYHAVSVQVCALSPDGKILMNCKCANDWRAVVGAVGKRCPTANVQAAIESCCGAAGLADELIGHAQWSVNLAHPGYVARMKQSPDKTDYTDARLLADLQPTNAARRCPGYLPKVWLAPEEVRELRRLVHYRQTLTRERRNLKLQIGATVREARQKAPATVNPWTKAWLAWLDRSAQLSFNARHITDCRLRRLVALSKELAQIDRRLEKQTKDDPLVQKLLTIKGIGLVTATTLRAEIGRFDRFRTGKQLARFCGLSPRNASSGEKQADAGLIQAGNTELKTLLVEAAHRLIRCEERWTALAARLSRRGKPPGVVVAAVANRWLRWLFHQVQPSCLAA